MKGNGPLQDLNPPGRRSLDGKGMAHEDQDVIHGGPAVRIMSLALRLVGPMALLMATSSTPALAQACATDVDCTAPLTCKPGPTACEGGGGILPDGGTYTLPTICQTGPATCTWVFATCQTDSACTLSNWGCLAFPGQSTVMMCFPKYMPCSASQPCPTAWSCLDSAQSRSRDPGLFWGVAGVSNYCWPDNLGGVFDGTTRTDSTGIGLMPEGTAVDISGAAGVSGAAGANGTEGGQGKVAGDAGMGSTPATQPAPASSRSGCTIAGPSGASTHLALLALALVGLLRLGRATRKK
jgi:hypothetical protein